MRLTTLDLRDTGTPGDFVTNVVELFGTLTSTLGNVVGDFGIRLRIVDKFTGVEVARDRAITDADGDWAATFQGVAAGVYKVAARPRNAEDGEPVEAAAIRRFELDLSADGGRSASLAVDDTADGRIDPTEALAVAYTVRGLDADATAEAIFTDVAGNVLTAEIADGRFTIDLSSFDLGVVRSELRITDSLGNVTTISGNDVILCFFPGTRIATADGEQAVEQLVAGDRVRLADGGCATVRFVARQPVATAFMPHAVPVLIRAGALAPGVPQRDLRVSPDHALCLDGLLVHAAALVNGRGILRDNKRFKPNHISIQ